MTLRRVLWALEVLVVLACAYRMADVTAQFVVSVERARDLDDEVETLTAAVDSLEARVAWTERAMRRRVTVTCYQAEARQTDDDPHITADGTRIVPGYAGRYGFVAVSRDLLAKNGGFLRYGDTVLLTGVGKKSGIYRVRDVMDARWTERVDILESATSTALYRFEAALVTLLEPATLEAAIHPQS